MIVRQTYRFDRDMLELLAERQDPKTDLALIHQAIQQLEQHPLIGEVYRDDIRRRYLPRLRAHIYYRHRPRAKRIELVRLWPATRMPLP